MLRLLFLALTVFSTPGDGYVHSRNRQVSQAESCVQVSVVGDATYCLKNSTICGGRFGACPRKGDIATENCIETLKSYIAREGNCLAPVDAVCELIPSGVMGCVFPNMDLKTTPLPTVQDINSKSPKTTANAISLSTNTPTTLPTISTTSMPDPICVEDFGQCDGQSRTKKFSKCCSSKNFTCLSFNAYYSQCLPMTQ